MNTPIGQRLRPNVHLRVVYSILALIIVSIDLWFVVHSTPIWMRVALVAVILVLYPLPNSVDRSSLGLRFTPIQPFTYWIRMIIVIGVVMLILISAFLVMATSLNWELAIPQIPPDQASLFFLYGCVLTPIFEEFIYRLVLCFPTTIIIGPIGAILLSGATFAGIHFLYGSPGPDNFFAGYILAWVYLKSGSIMIPIIMHSLGNLVVLIFYIGMWYVT